VSEALAKLIAPASDCLVCHGHTALEEQFLDVAQAQLKAEIPAHSATDDFGWETVTVIERFRFLHHAILRDGASNLTTPHRGNWMVRLALAVSRRQSGTGGLDERPRQIWVVVLSVAFAFLLPVLRCACGNCLVPHAARRLAADVDTCRSRKLTIPPAAVRAPSSTRYSPVSTVIWSRSPLQSG
jgi:hypothetical protein